MSEKASEVATNDTKSDVVVDSAEKWLSAVNVVAQYRLTRTDGTTMVVPLKGIPAKVYYSIRQQTMPIKPPMKREPQTDRRGKLVVGANPLEVEDRDDPDYRKSVDEMANKGQTLILDAALTFPIPGNTWQEKHKWLMDRLPGDVDKLYNFIILELLNLGAKVGSYL
jgi:hypothetical protein